jgi:septal ring factor EnvC (AmiA/AmiB activator)
LREDVMGFRKFFTAAALLLLIAIPMELFAQDIPGIEICTAEKAMDRRTSCLQSNIDFLQKTMTKQSADHLQKLDAATRQIEGLKAQVVSLQKLVADLQAQQKQIADELKKKADVAPKDIPTTKGK